MATALAISSAASADPLIVGSIAVGGGNDQWSGTGIVFTNTSALERDATGDLATVFLVSPATTPTTINQSNYLFSSPDVLILTTSTGGATFTITGPIDVSEDDNTFLNISGTGILTLTGYSPTLATFSFTSTDSGHNYGIGASSSSGFTFAITSEAVPAVPEPSSFLLFGSGLLSFAGLLRRKLAK